MSSRAPLFSMPSPIPHVRCVLRLLEPPGSCPRSLWERLLDGTYDKPFIIDSGERRFLHFDFDAIQSEMDVQHPNRLRLAYTRKMMLFLMFKRTPARILLLGLGGGSLAKFCYHHLPDAAITVVEMNPHVIALRDEFHVPPDDERFRVVCGDGAAYLGQLGRSKDVILVDACDRKGIAPELDTIEFYRRARSCLSAGGVFVANLCSEPNENATHLAKIRAVFGDEYLTLRVRMDGNLIVIALREGHNAIDWEGLESAAVNLKRQMGVNFPQYVRRMALSRKLRRWDPIWNFKLR